MSDSTQRRGTDYDTLRGMGAGAGSRVPRTGDDPLEELARLVSQNEPVKPSAQAAAGEPRSTYTAAPRAPQAQERFEAPSYGRPPAAPVFESRDQRAYGSSAQQGYGPSDDFFADLQPVPQPPRGGQGNDQGDYGYHADDFDNGFDGGFQTRSPFQDDFDTQPHPGIYADGGDVEDDLPARSRGGRFVKLGLTAAALALVGTAGVWGYGALTGGSTDGTPPVIKAENTTPVKVVAEAKPVVRAKADYSRIDPSADARVVADVEEPGEKPTPRVILPGAPASGTQERVTESASPATTQPPTASEPEQAGNGNSRRVRTVVIRPDGSMAAPEEPPSSVQALAAPEPPPPVPAPIQGTGPAAGMSMEPARDFGIMSETAPPPQTAAVTDEVPMPMPRPQTVASQPATPAAPTAQNDPFARQEAPAAPQMRAATPAPAPAPSQSAGGPPSSPQPQVQVTNKRPLKPVPGPRSSTAPSSTIVAAGTPAPQLRSANPVPLAPKPAPQAATPVGPRPVATNPARPTQVAMASSDSNTASLPVAPRAPQVATVAVASSGGGAFGVQLTAQRSEAEAVAAFNAIKQRNPGVLGSYSATVARADLGPDRGVFYRAMVPAANQSDAANLCIQFKAAGVDCIVQRR